MVKLPPEKELAQEYRNAFPPGSVVLADLERRFGRRRSFTPGQPDTSAFREGQRDVYLMILSFLDPQPQEDVSA